ncbi:MAG: thiamine pyrophosphate-dependent enzyme, partial [Candidatus Desantisbacteria bacterium]
KARSNNGPSIIVAKVPRIGAHSSSDDPKKYKTEKELLEEKTRDPITCFEQYLLREEVLDEKEDTAFVSPKFRLLDYPETITVSSGQTKTLTLNIENYGQIEGDVDIGFKFLDILDETNSLWIKPNEIGSVSFAFVAPDDLCGMYNGYLKTGEEQKVIRIELRDIEVQVSAMLDKSFYEKDEMATITISVIGSKPATLTAKVKLGQYEEEKTFSESPGQVQFSFPVSSFSEKLFYGIYTESGRALYLNSLYIREKKEFVNIYGEDVLVAGLPATISSEIDQPGRFSYLLFSEADEMLIDEPTIIPIEFSLSPDLLSGTYYLYWWFDTGTQTISGEFPFDVKGVEVKGLKSSLNKKSYKVKDRIEAEILFEANLNTSCLLKAWIEEPDGGFLKIAEEGIGILQGENTIRLKKEFIAKSPGLHRLLYSLYTQEGSLLLSWAISFDVASQRLKRIRHKIPDIIVANTAFNLELLLEDEEDLPYILPESSVISIGPGTITLENGATSTIASMTISSSPNRGRGSITISFGGLAITKDILILLTSGRVEGEGAEAIFGTYTTGFYAEIKRLTEVGTLSELPGNIGICYSIEAFDTDGTTLSEGFNITLAIPYQETGSIAEGSLKLYTFHQGFWQEIPSFLDTVNKKVYGTLTHLSLIAPVGVVTPTAQKEIVVYPNPARVFCGQNRITFCNIEQGSEVKIFNLSGELLFLLKDTENDQKIVWDITEGPASGVYIYVLAKKRGKIGIIR